MSDNDKYSREQLINANGDIEFHYSREHRLSHASERVQSLNDGKIPRPNLRKTLLSSKGNIMIFVTIVIFAVSGLAIRFPGRESGSSGSTIMLGGNTLVVAIIRIDDTLVLGITKKAPERGEVYIGEVDIAVSPAASGSGGNEAPQVFSHRVSFRPADTENFHIAVPFEGGDFFVVLRTGAEQKSMRLRVVKAD